jgi:hypothetical protein
MVNQILPICLCQALAVLSLHDTDSNSEFPRHQIAPQPEITLGARPRL